MNSGLRGAETAAGWPPPASCRHSTMPVTPIKARLASLMDRRKHLHRNIVEPERVHRRSDTMRTAARRQAEEEGGIAAAAGRGCTHRPIERERHLVAAPDRGEEPNLIRRNAFADDVDIARRQIRIVAHLRDRADIDRDIEDACGVPERDRVPEVDTILV